MAKKSPLKAIRREAAAHKKLTSVGINPNSAYNRLQLSNDNVDGYEAPRPRQSDPRNTPNVTYKPDGRIIVKPIPRKSMKTHIGTYSVAQKKKPTGVTKNKARSDSKATAKGVARVITKKPTTNKPSTPTKNAATADHNNDDAISISSAAPSNPPSSGRSTPFASTEYWPPCNGMSPSRHNHQLPSESLGIARIATFRVEKFTATLDWLLRKHGVQGSELQTSKFDYGGENLTDVELVFQDARVAQEAQERLDGEVVEGRKLGVLFL